MCLEGRKERDQFGMFVSVLKPVGCKVARSDPGESQLTNGGPQRRAHLRMQREVPEVCRDVIRQFAEEAHDQRRAGVVRCRVDAALSETRASELEGQVERRLEAEIRPVGSLKDKTIADGVPKGMGGDDDPLRAGWTVLAKLGELSDEGVGQGS